MWESIAKMVLAIIPPLERLLTRKPKPTEEGADPADIRQDTSAGEAYRRASHGPFTKKD